MHRITIQYVTPQDPEAFDRQYLDQHAPLVEKLPGLQAFTWSKPRLMAGDADIYLVAELEFEDKDALKTALTSPEMKTTAEDAATLGVAMTMFSGEVVTAF
ncbi:hypothetical protein ASD11_14495 [Aeromicrobium sp. Root495]|uniref:EthD family reductase n=1 Tax=Aeromicrobium sp. Root495 TaxID=1736550 RepID=UPI0006F54973|nr:EthD family reductase [Aeromicrobium sp. Root495]KQY55718.1 hypothetical protein ASD11_14495 [Aeromicrobium sp. Root495]